MLDEQEEDEQIKIFKFVFSNVIKVSGMNRVNLALE